jgi:hypothetical protein
MTKWSGLYDSTELYRVGLSQDPPPSLPATLALVRSPPPCNPPLVSVSPLLAAIAHPCIQRPLAKHPRRPRRGPPITPHPPCGKVRQQSSCPVAISIHNLQAVAIHTQRKNQSGTRDRESLDRARGSQNRVFVGCSYLSL